MSKSPTNTDKKSEGQKPTFINARRRGFLQSAAVVSAGASVSAGSAVASDLTEAVEPVMPKPVHRGYEETEHVREYYRKARS